MRMRIIEREGQQGQWTEKHCLARSKSQPLLPEIYSAPPNTKTPSLSPSLSQIHCKSKWINPRPQSDKTSRLQENWCQNSCHQANCTKLSTSLRRRSLILVREICEENRICHLCGKVAITEQRARPTTSPIHRRAQVCNAVVVVVDVVVDVLVVDVDVVVELDWPKIQGVPKKSSW